MGSTASNLCVQASLTPPPPPQSSSVWTLLKTPGTTYQLINEQDMEWKNEEITLEEKGVCHYITTQIVDREENIK